MEQLRACIIKGQCFLANEVDLFLYINLASFRSFSANTNSLIMIFAQGKNIIADVVVGVGAEDVALTSGAPVYPLWLRPCLVWLPGVPAPPQNHCSDTIAWSRFGFRGKNELRRGEAGGATIWSFFGSSLQYTYSAWAGAPKSCAKHALSWQGEAHCLIFFGIMHYYPIDS